MQAMEAPRQEEREEEERSKRAKIDEGRSPKNKTLADNLSNAANNIQEQKAAMLNATPSSSASTITETPLDKKNDKEAMEEDCTAPS